MAEKLKLQRTDSMTVKECFEEYINKCIIKNLSEKTIKLYRNQFNVFLRTLDDEEMLIDDISSKDIEHFILTERQNKKCNESSKVRCCAREQCLMSFIRVLHLPQTG